MPDITILNGRKHKMKHTLSRRGQRHARRNPDESLASQAGSAALATVIAAPAAIILDRAISGMKKKDGTLLYTENQSALLLGAIGVVGGVALHVKGFSPKTGVALIAACGTLAGRRALVARQAAALAAASQAPAATIPATTTTTTTTSTPAADFTITVTPVTASVTPLATAVVTQEFTISVASRGAIPATPVSLAVTGLTAGVTSSLSRTSIGPGESSKLTLSVPQASPAATIAFSIAGTNPSGTVSASATLVVGTAASQGPFGYTRRLNAAGAAYGAQYGQVSRLADSGAALGAEQWQGYSLSRPRIVPATATSAQIQGDCGPAKMTVQTPFAMPTMPASSDLPTAKRQQEMQLDATLAQIGEDAAQEQAMLMEQGMPPLILNGRNFGTAVMEGQDVMASKGAGGQWSDEQAQQRAAMLQDQSSAFDQRAAFEAARRKRAMAQECSCAASPSGARVLRRGRI